jgi:hypothetical protein
MRGSHAARRTRAPQHGEFLNQQKQEKRPGSDDGSHRKRRTGRLAIRQFHCLHFFYIQLVGTCVFTSFRAEASNVRNGQSASLDDVRKERNCARGLVGTKKKFEKEKNNDTTPQKERGRVPKHTMNW